MATPTLTLPRWQRTTGIRSVPLTRSGNVTWIAFVLAQVSDGALTYVGISTFGPGIEANPLLAWLIAATGLGSAILSAKAFALGCGTLLHLQGMHRSLAALTAVYAGVAVCQWIAVLWPGLLL
jgi:hypothetical protein